MSSPRRIVVVDDDPKVRLLLEHVLQPPEFEVHVFPNGAEALRRLPEIRPDCVVSDFVMPTMDGETLLRAARDLPGLERLPFIMISALRSEGRIRSVLAAGAAAFLQKPFPLKQLVEKIRTVLEEAGGGGASLGEPAFTPSSAVPSSAPAPAPGTREARASAGVSADESRSRRTELKLPDSVKGAGRFTRVELGLRSFVVLTEYSARPRFTVTTVIAENGVALRKTESSLKYPLGREEDRPIAHQQVGLQHEEVLQHLSALVTVATPRRVLWPSQRRSVDPGLLAWTISAVAQQAEADVGTEATVRLLRLTRDRVSNGDETLLSFDVTYFGRVVVDLTGGSGRPRRAVDAVARWCSAFAAEALHAGGDEAVESIRQATRSRASELEGLHFYEQLGRRLEA